MATKKRRARDRESAFDTTSRQESPPRRRPPTAATRKKRTRGSHPNASVSVTEEHIRLRAYYLSLGRDGRSADPVGVWLRAECELSAGASGQDGARLARGASG